jgi:hypothetical protein
MVFVKVKHFYIKIRSKLVGSRKKICFIEYFVTPAFVKTTFHVDSRYIIYLCAVILRNSLKVSIFHTEIMMAVLPNVMGMKRSNLSLRDNAELELNSTFCWESDTDTHQKHIPRSHISDSKSSATVTQQNHFRSISITYFTLVVSPQNSVLCPLHLDCLFSLLYLD